MIITIQDKKAATLAVKWDKCPQDVFHFALYETMLEGDKDLGMFPTPRGCCNDSAPDVQLRRSRGGTYSGSVTQKGITTDISAWADGETLMVAYTVTAGRDAKNLQVHPCLMTTYAPHFIGKRKGSSDYREMGKRVMLDNKGRKSLASFGSDKHQAVVGDGARVTKWAWWKNASRRFRKGVTELWARDSKLHLVWDGDKTTWISSNMGDNRSCWHRFAWIGSLKKGESRTVSMKMWIVG